MGIFDSENRNSAQNPSSGGSNWSIPRQVINAIFGRNPTFFNAGLGDVIAPIVDTTLYYPLQPTSAEQRKTFTNPGDDMRIIWRPPDGKHWMVYFMNAGVIHIPATGVEIETIITVTNRINIVISWLQLPAFPAIPPIVPIIGGRWSASDVLTVPNSTTAPIMWTGTKSVYLNHTMSLIVSGQAVFVPGDTTSSQIIYLELPESQPFGPALTL